LDTGFTCTTGVAAPKGADTIGWVGDYVYLCKDDDTLQRVSLVDGSTDEVSISCKLVTDYNGAIMVHNQTSCPLSPKELTVFDTFQDVLNGTPSATISPVNVKGSRVAAQGSTLYHSWHSLSSDDQEDKIERIELPSGDDLSGVKPIGHDGWVNAIDVTTDGLLVIFNKPAGELEVYDAQTGSYVGAVSQTQYTLVDGIACVKTP